MCAQSAYAMLTLVLAMSSPSRAAAQVSVTRHATTGVSGYRANERVLETPSSSDYISQVEWGEHRDAPCAMVMRYHSLGSWGSSSGVGLNLCSEHISFPLYLANADVRYVSLGNTSSVQEYVRGVQVCTNNASNHRLKGVRLFGIRYEQTTVDGVRRVSLTNVSGYDEARHTNCATWHSVEYCPVNTVAFALLAHVSDGSVVGLALRCRVP